MGMACCCQPPCNIKVVPWHLPPPYTPFSAMAIVDSFCDQTVVMHTHTYTQWLHCWSAELSCNCLFLQQCLPQCILQGTTQSWEHCWLCQWTQLPKHKVHIYTQILQCIMSQQQYLQDLKRFYSIQQCINKLYQILMDCMFLRVCYTCATDCG